MALKLSESSLFNVKYRRNTIGADALKFSRIILNTKNPGNVKRVSSMTETMAALMSVQSALESMEAAEWRREDRTDFGDKLHARFTAEAEADTLALRAAMRVGVVAEAVSLNTSLSQRPGPAFPVYSADKVLDKVESARQAVERLTQYLDKVEAATRRTMEGPAVNASTDSAAL
jgi:hypothetical protein